MAQYLLEVTETYRADSEKEAAQLIEDAKNDNKYTLSKYTSTFKERKQKGEVVDTYYKVVLTKKFDDEKEPIGDASIEYKIGAF